MNARKSMLPALSLVVRNNALVDAFVHHKAFTVQAFCKAHSLRPNRHTRATLNKMVAEGMLAKHKTLYDDGHYRMVYSAQLTKRIPGL